MSVYRDSAAEERKQMKPLLLHMERKGCKRWATYVQDCYSWSFSSGAAIVGCGIELELDDTQRKLHSKSRGLSQRFGI